MAAIKIPEGYRPGFTALVAMSDSAFEEFLSAVKQAPNTFANTREVEAWIGSEVKSIPHGNVSKIVEAITSLYPLRSRLSMTVNQLAEGLAEGFQHSIKNAQPSVDGIDIAKRIASLLSLDAFNITSVKAKDLQNQAERILIDARILTDLRPVYGDKIEAVPPALLVVHTLKIVTHESDGHKEYFIALDLADISALKKVIERAEEKTQSLQALLDAKGLQLVDLSEKE